MKWVELDVHEERGSICGEQRTCNEEGCASGWAQVCQERIDVQVELW
jgi:hypothetical protein